MLSIIVEVKGIHEVLSISGCPLAFFHFKHLSHNIIYAFVNKYVLCWHYAGIGKPNQCSHDIAN